MKTQAIITPPADGGEALSNAARRASHSSMDAHCAALGAAIGIESKRADKAAAAADRESWDALAAQLNTDSAIWEGEYAEAEEHRAEAERRAGRAWRWAAIAKACSARAMAARAAEGSC